MVRVILGSAVAAVAMLVIGFLVYATPLSSLGSGNVGSIQATIVQNVLRDNLPSTGTYVVPDPGTAEQTELYGRGPIATIHYSKEGHAAGGTAMFLVGLVLNFVVALLIGLGLIGIDRRVPDLASRGRLVVAFAVAAAAFIHLGPPIYAHYDWSNAIFGFVGDALALAVGGLIVAWFLPRHRAEPARTNAPSEG